MSSTHASAPKIFKRKDSPNYWVRFSITGQGQIRLSLGTRDEAEAQRLAQREYQRAVLRAEEGLLAVKSSFEKVAREYIAELKASVKTGAAKPYVQRDYPPVIERYFIAYFGKKPIDAITSGDISRYQSWRKSYWTMPLGEQSYRIRATGKKASHRDIVPMDAANAALEMLWNIFELEVGREPQDDDPLFSNADGSRIQSFKKGLAELLKAADLLHDRTGNRRSSYSFRHYYISRQILDGVDIFAIAINTRTSVQMIQQYYASELIPDDVAERLRGVRRF